MTRLVVKIFLLVIMFKSFDCYSQNRESDSIEVSRVSINFFNWYITSAKNHKTDDYNSAEIENKNGMTTLDFSKYFKNLTRLSFSDSLFAKERALYNECILKLSQVKYSEYLKLTDLDQFENLNADFTNYYRWIGGQEMLDVYAIKNVRIENRNAFVVGSLYFDYENVQKSGFVKEIITTFTKQNGVWKINDIKY